MHDLILAQQSGASSPGAAVSFLPIILIIGIFYLLIYRPMRRRQKNLEAMVSSLKNGDKVITSGGVHGTIAGVKENTVILKVADQVKIEVAKSAIASMQMPPSE
jgi:preprotein translocase subunit YajC